MNFTENDYVTCVNNDDDNLNLIKLFTMYKVKEVNDNHLELYEFPAVKFPLHCFNKAYDYWAIYIKTKTYEGYLQKSNGSNLTPEQMIFEESQILFPETTASRNHTLVYPSYEEAKANFQRLKWFDPPKVEYRHLTITVDNIIEG
jgi:hypothetical protein